MISRVKPQPEAFAEGAAQAYLPSQKLELLNKGLLVWKDDPLLHQHRAELLIPMKRYSEALKDLDTTIRFSAADAVLSLRKAETLSALRRFREAVELCGKFPKTAHHMRMKLVNDRTNKREYDFAFSILEEMKKVGENGVELDYLRGTCLLKMERYADAIKEFTKCLAQSKDHYLAWFQRGKCKLASGNPKDSIPDFTRAIELKPSDLYYRTRAKAYAQINQHKQCLNDLSKAIELKRCDENYTARARIYLKLKDPSKAVADLSKAIKANKDCSLAYDLRAEAYRSLNRADLASLDDSRARQTGRVWEEKITGEESRD
ncbi:MAG: tetratricopeptide repeat protein [Cyanobacteria bacterium]|nr:tetratricopeptide repeat protein [Cyanobacteriota bacterium]